MLKRSALNQGTKRRNITQKSTPNTPQIETSTNSFQHNYSLISKSDKISAAESIPVPTFNSSSNSLRYNNNSMPYHANHRKQKQRRNKNKAKPSTNNSNGSSNQRHRRKVNTKNIRCGDESIFSASPSNNECSVSCTISSKDIFNNLQFIQNDDVQDDKTYESDDVSSDSSSEFQCEEKRSRYSCNSGQSTPPEKDVLEVERTCGKTDWECAPNYIQKYLSSFKNKKPVVMNVHNGTFYYFPENTSGCHSVSLIIFYLNN